MGLHIYVGTLCRYYSGDRPRGALGKIVSFFKPNPASPERIRAWRDGLGARGCFGSVTDWNWPESLDLDYVTDKPSADGWGAARLWAAYAEQPQLTAPRELAGDWEQDPVLAAAADFEQIHRPELWLPVEFDNVFEAEEVSGARSRIGSVYALDRQLRRLNTATWNADEETIASWSFEVDPDGLESTARWGYSIWFRLVQTAAKRRLPMRLDY